MKIKTVKMIEETDFSSLVQKTYGRTYCLQQQDGCKDRGIEEIKVPVKHPYDYDNDEIPEVVNHDTMGVSFEAWLTRDPVQAIEGSEHGLELWWCRNFYPHLDMVINDLYKKGLLEAGDYLINIDW